MKNLPKYPFRLGELGILFAFVFLTHVAWAGNKWQPFNRAAFEKAQASGQTVILSVHADW